MLFLASDHGVTVNEHLIGKDVVAVFEDGSFLYKSGRTADEILAEGEAIAAARAVAAANSKIDWWTEEDLDYQVSNDYLVEPVTREQMETEFKTITGKLIASYVSWSVNDSEEIITNDTIAEIVKDNLIGPISKKTANFDYVSKLLIKKYRFVPIGEGLMRAA